MVFVTSVATGSDNGAKVRGSSASSKRRDAGLMKPATPRNSLIAAVRNGRFGECGHAIMQRAGEPQNRQCQRRARSLTQPQIEVEKRLRVERLQHQPVAQLRRAMRENQV